MKYLIIAMIIALAFVVVYSRLRPYLLLIKKVAGALDESVNVNSNSKTAQSKSAENKLVKCAGCQTWIPADRALTLRRGVAVYCSPECLEIASR